MCDEDYSMTNGAGDIKQGLEHLKDILTAHERFHTGKTQYRCSCCSYSTDNEEVLITHERSYQVKNSTNVSAAPLLQ